jgi:hypothetical protein
MATMQGSEAARELENGAPGHRAVVEIFRRLGARALVGFEFYLRDGREGARKRVRVERLNPNGLTYRVVDVRAETELAKDVLPAEMSIGLETRAEGEPVVKLL